MPEETTLFESERQELRQAVIEELTDPFLTYLSDHGIWFHSKWNFIFLVLLTITFIFWLTYKLYLRKRIERFEINPDNTLISVIVNFRFLFWVFLAIFVFRFYLVDHIRMNGDHIYLKAKAGSRIIAFPSYYGLRAPGIKKYMLALNKPRRGEYVTYHIPELNKTTYVGKIVGLENESVELDLPNKKFVVNGRQMDFPFTLSNLTEKHNKTYHWKIPANKVLILPDKLSDEILSTSFNYMGKEVDLSELLTNQHIVDFNNLLGKIVYTLF